MPRRVQWWYGCLLLSVPLTRLPFWLPLSWRFLKPPGRSPDLFWEATPHSSLIFVSVLLFPVRIGLQLMRSVSIAILYLRHRLLWVFSATLSNLILPVLNNFISIANYSYAIHLLFQIAYEYLEYNGFLYFASSYPYIQRTVLFRCNYASFRGLKEGLCKNGNFFWDKHMDLISMIPLQ